MQVTIEVPDDLAAKWQAEGLDPAAVVLEATALEAYRRYQIYEYPLRLMLGLESRSQVWALFAKYEVPRQYSAQDLADDIAGSDKCQALHEEPADRAA